MAKPIAFLDANVLYPAPVRDLLLNLADVGSYQPKWSAEVQEEWLRSILLVRNDLDRDRLLQSQIAMDAAFPDAMEITADQFFSQVFSNSFDDVIQTFNAQVAKLRMSRSGIA